MTSPNDTPEWVKAEAVARSAYNRDRPYDRGAGDYTGRDNNISMAMPIAPPPSFTISQRLDEQRAVVSNLDQLIDSLAKRLDCILTEPDTKTGPGVAMPSGPGGYRFIADDIRATTTHLERYARQLEDLHRRLNL
jgi:hypothetical protein